jgi:hypothetical protein
LKNAPLVAPLYEWLEVVQQLQLLPIFLVAFYNKKIDTLIALFVRWENDQEV